MLNLIDRINTYKHYEPLLKQLKVQKKLPGIYMEYHESSFDHGSNGDRVFQYV